MSSGRRWSAGRRAVAAAGLWALLAGAAAAQLLELGPEVEIIAETAGSVGRPAVAMAPDGRSAVAWFQALPDEGSEAIHLQLFNADGDPAGAVVEVVEDPGGGFRLSADFSVAAGTDGAFLVVWRDDSIRCRTVGPDGALGPERILADAPDVGHEMLRPAVAGDPRGGFVAAWRQKDRIVLWRLDASGGPVGPERLVADDGVAGVAQPALSVGPSGGIVVVWRASVSQGNFAAYEIHGRWFAPDGSPLGEPSSLASRPSDEGIGVTHLSGGDVLTAWVSRESGPPPFRLALRRFDAFGRPLAEALLDVPETDLGTVEEIVAVPLVGGGAVLAWIAERASDPLVEGLLVDASLARVAGPVRLSFFDFGGTRFPGLASDSLSEVFAVWEAGDFGAAGVYGRRLRAAAAGAFGFAEPTRLVKEGDGSTPLSVRRIGFDEGTVSVRYRAEAGTAEPGEDFQPVQGELSWADGDRSERTIELPVLQDRDFEGPEVIRVVLSDPTGGAVLGELREAQVVIEDDDGRPAPGGPPSPLSAEDVACDRARLEGLLERIELSVTGSSKTAGLNLSVTASGDFAGIAYTGNGPASAEHHLAFSTDPEVTPLLLNPERPQLPAVALARNPVNSDLVAPGDSDVLEMTLRPTLGSGEPPPAALLVIDNLDGAAGRASQVKPGRGLAGLLAPCHRDLLVARDLHVLRVLSKIARLEVDGAARTELAIHRSAELDAYGIDARAFDGTGRLLGTLVARVEVTYTADGLLSGGELALVPPCPGGAGAGCTTLDRPGRLLLVRPTFTGELWTPTPYQVRTPAGSGGDAAALDWSDLLGGSTWRRPR